MAGSVSEAQRQCESEMEARLVFEPGFPARCSIRSDHAGTDWPEHLAMAREAIMDKLAAHGALVLRGALRKNRLGQSDPERLEQVASSLFQLAGKEIGGVEGTRRRKRVGNVNAPVSMSQLYKGPSATKAERAAAVIWHQELAFFPPDLVPDALALCCHELPESGGATPLTLSSRLQRSLQGELGEIQSELGEILDGQGSFAAERRIPSDGAGAKGPAPTWQSLFDTDDRAAVALICSERGWDLEWDEQHTATITMTQLPMHRAHPRTGELMWCNAVPPALRMWSKVTMASGRVLNKVRHVAELQQAFVDSEPIEYAWTDETKDDILLIDNYTAVHAGPVSWGGSRAMLQTYGWGYGTTPGSKGF